jgi:DHA1 family bicyclomycin/chloramphenicol resistance-like MFS transporter
MTGNNALSLALVNYKHCTGTASSFFGFFYYGLVFLFTFGMGFLHNGTLLPMPLYFLSLSIFMMALNRFMLKD